MEKTFEGLNLDDPEAVKMAIEECLAELRRQRETARDDYAQLAADREEIEQLGIETRAILAEIGARQERRSTSILG